MSTEVEFSLGDWNFTACVTREWEPPTWPERGEKGYEYFVVDNIACINSEELSIYNFPSSSQIKDAAIEAYRKYAKTDPDRQHDKDA